MVLVLSPIARSQVADNVSSVPKATWKPQPAVSCSNRSDTARPVARAISYQTAGSVHPNRKDVSAIPVPNARAVIPNTTSVPITNAC